MTTRKQIYRQAQRALRQLTVADAGASIKATIATLRNLPAVVSELPGKDKLRVTRVAQSLFGFVNLLLTAAVSIRDQNNEEARKVLLAAIRRLDALTASLSEAVYHSKSALPEM